MRIACADRADHAAAEVGHVERLDADDETNERLDAMRRTVLVFVPLRAWAATKEHEQLLGLIRSGAGSGEIEACARVHKLRTIEAYLRQAETQTEAAAAGM